MDSTRRVTGRQLTAIIVAICAAVILAPAGVYAASHSNVSIVDHKHPTRGATVSKKGALTVAGTVKVSGAPSVKVSGTPTVKLSGTSVVAAVPTLRGTPFGATMYSGGPDITVPSGKTLVVTTISGYDEVSPGKNPYAALHVYGGALQGEDIPLPMTFSETVTSGSPFDVWVGTSDVEIPLPGPGHISLLHSTSGGTIDGPQITVVGYLI